MPILSRAGEHQQQLLGAQIARPHPVSSTFRIPTITSKPLTTHILPKLLEGTDTTLPTSQSRQITEAAKPTETRFPVNLLRGHGNRINNQ